MRWIATFAAFLALACAACTSSSGGDPAPSFTPPHTTVSASAPVTSSMSATPPHPTRPGVPPDVPRTGPNTKPGEKPPVMPLAATQHTAAGAKAFAEFFIKTIDWGYATTSSTYMRHYSSPRCGGCRDFVTGFDSARRRGHHYVGGRISITHSVIAAHPFAPHAELSVLLTFDISAIEELDKHAHFVDADGAHSGQKFEVSMSWRSNQWDIVQLGVDSR